ncbi:MAG: hypothetical protein PHN44_01885 [Candidatus Marinimicrobia bacterium]|nr:hypothetical protein [Candidatus Neomarinimicrobiota bacterium]
MSPTGWIGIDIDGTVRNWIAKVIEIYRREMPDKRVNENITQYDIAPFFEIGRDIYKYAFGEWAEEVYLQANPYPDAVKFIRKLKNQYKFFFISCQPNLQTVEHTCQWMVNYFGLDIPTTIFTKDKESFPVMDILLDDCTENLIKTRDAGIRSIAIDRFWNQDWTGERIKKYDEFFSIIKELKIYT